MKSIIYILFALSIFSSCAPTKKLTKTVTHTESELVVQVKDSTTTSITWQSFMATLESSIDLSTIHLISYYTQKDSITGKQLIKEEITVQKNITAKKETQKKEEGESKAVAEVVTSITQKIKEDFKQEIVQKKGSSSFKLYVIIALLAIAVLAFFTIWVKRFFKL